MTQLEDMQGTAIRMSKKDKRSNVTYVVRSVDGKFYMEQQFEGGITLADTYPCFANSSTVETYQFGKLI
jgi:hypothetical protein